MFAPAFVLPLASVFLLAFAVPTRAQGTVYVGMGDSIGESVQSADANEFTQPFSYLNLLAWRLGVPFPQPLIGTSPFAIIGSTSGRPRLDPSAQGLNLAVSGADTQSILFDRADALDTGAIDSETDLVLFPRLGSQVEIAESLAPQLVACWIGNNDVLASITSFDQLDASQLTPLLQFTAQFTELADRLQAMGSKVVFATIPNVSSIGFAADRQDLIRLLGSDYGFPETSRTSIVAIMLVKMGLVGPEIFTLPNFVLDAAELATIQNHVVAINAIIHSVAASHGMAVADVHAAFEAFVDTPPVLLGIPLTGRFGGGLLSLDGVHPSNIAHALVANMFIERFNSHYGLAIAPIDLPSLAWFLVTDPFIDKDGDGKVVGRFGAGALETVLPFLGISGDLDDALPTATTATTTENDTLAAVSRFEQEAGKPVKQMSRAEVLDAARKLFGLHRFTRPRSH